MSKMAQALAGLHGEQIALSDVSVSATLQDLLAEVTVSQTYHNRENRNIEAVYTFPLPLDAVLLDLTVEIAARVLKGVVVEKGAAEERYEEAIEDGDSAVMLEAIEPGLYTMNVGNLMPYEKATITFKYAMLYRWAGDRLRFFLPTTIAPRYGVSPHQPHQVPEHSLTVENQFSLEVKISGDLRKAQFNCPSHDVRLTHADAQTIISLQQKRAVMDRDFILNIKAPNANKSFAIRGMDGNGSAVVASLMPFFPGLQQPRRLDLVFLIDCSGSMGGDSMSQAKQALAGMIDALGPDDRVTLIAFGSTTKALSKKLLSCNKSNLAKLKKFAETLDADMGGTELGRALQQAYAATSNSQCADIFLVTDGEVGSWQRVVDEAKSSGNRIFTVGVGSAVSEAFVRELASETGGHCELVSPREGMADRVIRHFERMRSPRAKQTRIQWPEGAYGIAPSKQIAVFEGDTIVASAQFTQPSDDSLVSLEIETEEGEVFHQEVLITKAAGAVQDEGMSTVARVAASLRLKDSKRDSGAKIAVHYQLVSPWTNWLVIAERPQDDKAQNTPALRKVPHTLAAGWGGTGSTADLFSAASPGSIGRSELPMISPKYLKSNVAFCREASREKTDWSKFPPQIVQLFELILDDPSILHPDNAMRLLEKSGFIPVFRELLDLAQDLELEMNMIVSMIVDKLFSGSIGEYLPDSAHSYFAELQNRAREAAKLLSDISRVGKRLAKATEWAVRDGVLQNASVEREFVQRIDYYHGLDELLSRLNQYENFLQPTKKERDPIQTEQLTTSLGLD